MNSCYSCCRAQKISEVAWQQLELVPALPSMRTWSYHSQAKFVPFGSWHDRHNPANAWHVCTQCMWIQSPPNSAKPGWVCLLCAACNEEVLAFCRAAGQHGADQDAERCLFLAYLGLQIQFPPVGINTGTWPEHPPSNHG